MVDHARLAARAVVHRLDAVARLIEDERAVVLRPVCGPRPGGAVALVALVGELVPPGVDGFP